MRRSALILLLLLSIWVMAAPFALSEEMEGEEVACLPAEEVYEAEELDLTDDISPEETELDLSGNTDIDPDIEIFAEPDALTAWPELGIDGDEAIEGYIQRQLYAGTDAMPLLSAGVSAGSSLDAGTPERRLYDALKPMIREVAEGSRASTVFTVPINEIYDNVAYTAADLGVDALVEDGKISQAAQAAFNQTVALSFTRVLNALMADMPYEMFWYDKTQGTVYKTLPISYRAGTLFLTNYDAGTLSYSFRVSAAYSLSGATQTFDIDVDKLSSIQTAVGNARQIVEKYSDLSDIDKLYAYKEDVCALASYNREAPKDGSDYGNPWQLIWVFDGIEETQVVCEGYAKAFQYLCELSDFAGDVSVVSAFGKLYNESNSGGDHMWNNVRIDGETYLADLTNCDIGTAGYPDQLFLKGWSSRDDAAYYYETTSRVLRYSYDAKFTALFGDEILSLSERDAVLYSDEYGGLRWTLDNGGTLRVQGSGAIPDSAEDAPAPWCEGELGALVLRVELAEGVTRLGNRAFYSCPSLAEVSLPGTLTELGEDAFAGPVSITLTDCGSLAARAYAEERGLACSFTHSGIVTDAAVSAGCVESGLTEGSHCETCGDVFVAQEAVPAKGHSPVTVPAVSPTYTSAGLTEGSKCSVCGAVLVAQQPVAKLTAAPDYSLHMSKSASKSVNKGTPIQIVVDGKAVKSYKSSNKKVAAVTKTGWVTTKKAGTAKITITLKSKKKLTLKLKVVDPSVPKSIKLLQGKTVTLKVGQTLALSAAMSPDTAVSKLKWKSANKKIASVSQQGVVTAKKAGKVKITVTTANKKKAVITVRVVK